MRPTPRRRPLPRRHAQEMRAAALRKRAETSNEYLSAYHDVTNMAYDLARRAERSFFDDTKKLLIDSANGILAATGSERARFRY